MQHGRSFPAKANAFSAQAQGKLPPVISSFPSRLRSTSPVHLRKKLFREALCLRARPRLAIANPVPHAAALAQENRERRCRQRQSSVVGLQSSAKTVARAIQLAWFWS